jgi:hypothetical protein
MASGIRNRDPDAGSYGVSRYLSSDHFRVTRHSTASRKNWVLAHNGLLLLARFLLLNSGGKDLFHRQIGPAAQSSVQLVAAVGPDRVRDTPERNQAFVIAVLVALVNRRTWKDSSAIVFVGAGRAVTRVGRP